MNAGLGWIDFSTEHRDKVYSVVDMLSDSGTVDELGIGPIRDAIADWLFPGISTIQTRPKYFILIPQLLLKYFRLYYKHSKPPVLKDFLRKEENNLIFMISENYEFQEGNGVIGVSVAKKRGELSRKPSSIYWNGLRTHGIIKTEFSLNDYLIKNDLNNLHGTASEEDLEHSNEEHFSILMPPSTDIPDNTKLNLTEEEAKFLRDQFIADGKNKEKFNMLKHILKSKETMLITLESENFTDFAFNFLENPSTPEPTKKVLLTARSFNFLIHGAHIRYNILLHRKSGNLDFSEDWEKWRKELNNDKAVLFDLDLNYLFEEIAPNAPLVTKVFIKTLKAEFLKADLDTANIDLLITKQERIKKGSRSKLGSKSNQEEFDKWVGIYELEYRFTQAQTLTRDILNAYA